MLWLNFLHFYQPASIDTSKIVEATKLSYERILRALEEHPDVKFTINITGCLLVRWAEELKRQDLIERINKLIKNGQIELVGSAAYHPLLPLISEKEAKQQILEQEQILKKYFGKKLKLKGFFLPELAYSPKIAKLIKKLGYEWILIDEVTTNKASLESNICYIDQASGLKLAIRNRAISDKYVPESINSLLTKQIYKSIITATDAELYGLRHIDQPASFEKLLKSEHLQTNTISAHLKSLKTTKAVKLVASSWQTSIEEIKAGQPFPLWQADNNLLHQKIWKLADLAQKLYWKHLKNKNTWWSRWHLVRGIASCTFWWASGRDLRKVFGPLAWNPDEIEKGVNDLARSIRSLESSTSLADKLAVEKLVNEIKVIVWTKHWSEHSY